MPNDRENDEATELSDDADEMAHGPARLDPAIRLRPIPNYTDEEVAERQRAEVAELEADADDAAGDD